MQLVELVVMSVMKKIIVYFRENHLINANMGEKYVPREREGSFMILTRNDRIWRRQLIGIFLSDATTACPCHRRVNCLKCDVRNERSNDVQTKSEFGTVKPL